LTRRRHALGVEQLGDAEVGQLDEDAVTRLLVRRAQRT
jgi:hypothetical protein